MQASLAVVIPCFNVQNHIEKVILSIPDDVKWIIAVNDCSTDNTPALLDQLSSKNPKVICIHHPKNRGVGGAMLSGYAKALEVKADIVIKMDGDGQMDPTYIPALIKPLLANRADFTKGNRFRDFRALRAMPLGRRIGNLGLSFIIKAASGYWNIFDPTNGFTAIRGDTLEALDKSHIHKGFYFETSMLQELYFVNAVVLDVPMKARYNDEVSSLSPVKILVEFPPKLFLAFFRRIILKYFLIDFTVASLYIMISLPLLSYGVYFGIANFIRYTSSHIPAPTGTIIIPTLLIILGFQLLLAAISYDIDNYPKR